MLEFIKKYSSLIAIALSIVAICLAIYAISINKEYFKVTHQDHSQIIQKIDNFEAIRQEHGQLLQKTDNIEDRHFDKEFCRLLETENSILHDRLEKSNENYDVLLDDYLRFL